MSAAMHNNTFKSHKAESCLTPTTHPLPIPLSNFSVRHELSCFLDRLDELHKGMYEGVYYLDMYYSLAKGVEPGSVFKVGTVDLSEITLPSGCVFEWADTPDEIKEFVKGIDFDMI